MKVALITTTINVPQHLRLLRRYGEDVRFFIAGDLKSPHSGITNLLSGSFYYLLPDEQKEWKCSEIIGWNCIQRRNIALLEALRWDADIIVSWDDDNIPLDRNYFTAFEEILSEPFDGLQASSETGWWSAYGFLLHRGFPHNIGHIPHYMTVTDAKVGVAAGLVLGDPDINAYTRLTKSPILLNGDVLDQAGYVVAADVWTVFNTQNTAFLREFAPAMFCPPAVGRYDDIIASLICQRVMRDRGYQVHFGPPFVWQERNPHDLLKDLRAEIWGMEHLLELAAWLDCWDPGAVTVVDMCKHFWATCTILPQASREAALAFLADIDELWK